MSSRNLALCGVLTALAVTILIMSGFIPAAMFCGPALAMVVLLPVLEEIGSKAALTAYAAAAILALLLAADRETSLIYVFFGWYPVLRPKIAALPSRLGRLAMRLAVCNGVILILYGLVLRLIGLTADLEAVSRLFQGILLVTGSILFLLLDRALERMTLLWRYKLRKRFFR